MSSLEARIKRLEAKKQITKEDDYFSQFRGLTFEQFWSKVGPAKKVGTTGAIYPYEYDVIEALKTSKYLWIKKATGLGISEFFLRWIAWNALKDDQWQYSQVCIVTGPRIELANTIIQRMKNLFEGYSFKSKETVCELNKCRIEAYPSHHLDTARGLPNVKVFMLDEADFFPPGEQKDARDVSERYIAKSDPYIIMISTPNIPGGLFEAIEKEKDCLYHRLFFNYEVGLGHIYTDKDIELAKKSPSFEREYNLKYGYGIGNIFPYQLVDAITLPYDLTLTSGDRVLAVDPAYGSSKFAIVGMEMLDGIMYVKEAKQYERPSPSAMLEEVQRMSRDYYRVYVDSAHPGLIRDLRETGVNVEPIIFSKQLGNAEQGMVADASRAVREQRVRIHPAFSELAYQLKAVKFDEKGKPDKKELSFDLGDAFMMAIYMLGGAGLKIFSVEPEKPVVQDAKEPVWTEDGWVYR